MRKTLLYAHWADMQVAEDGAISYGSGRQLCGMVTADLTHKTVTNEIYESGASIYNKAYVVGGSIALSTHTFSEADKARILHSINISDDKNIDYEEGGDEDTPKRGAFGFAILEEEKDTGESYYVCYWYYDCSFGPADASYATSDQNGINGEPDKLTINFVRRPTDRKYRRTAVVKSIEEMENFFQTVQKTA